MATVQLRYVEIPLRDTDEVCWDFLCVFRKIIYNFANMKCTGVFFYGLVYCEAGGMMAIRAVKFL